MFFHIKFLSIKDILKFARENSNIDDYLPTYNITKHTNCDWLWNVVNTIVNSQFEKFVI